MADVPDPEVSERASRPTCTAKCKLEILAEYERLDKAGKGALLRREGLYPSLVSAWRAQRDAGALAALSASRSPRMAMQTEHQEVGESCVICSAFWVWPGTCGPTTLRSS